MIFEKKIVGLYRKTLFVRQERAYDTAFFDYTDFPGLCRDEYSFISVKGDRLYGAFYRYPGASREHVIVFDHGMSSGGHLAYMTEIEILASRGYTVFSYDHTGCYRSEGETSGGFSQSLSDLDCALRALKAEPSLSGASFSVIGHSWGAYSCLNIASFHPDVKHIIAMSGFVSVADMHRQLFSGIMSFYRKALMNVERASNPDYVDSNALSALMNTDAQVLIIHSSDDPIVKAGHHFEKLRAALSGRENIEFLLLEGKAHNPNYTAEAVKYLAEFTAELTEKRASGELSDEKKRNAFVNSFDWKKMTEQDGAVWEKIFAVLER